MKRLSVLVGAIAAAIAASACCILPLILGTASAGSVGLRAVLTPYRPYLVALTLMPLGAGFYFTYRTEKAACGADGSSAAERTLGMKRLSKTMLWLITLFTIFSMAYPEIAAYRVHSQANSIPVGTASDKAKTVVFTVGKMTCEECTLSIAKAVKNTPGVYNAKVDFASKHAAVRYDEQRVSVPEIRKAIEKTGFPVLGKTVGEKEVENDPSLGL